MSESLQKKPFRYVLVTSRSSAAAGTGVGPAARTEFTSGWLATDLCQYQTRDPLILACKWKGPFTHNSLLASLYMYVHPVQNH